MPQPSPSATGAPATSGAPPPAGGERPRTRRPRPARIGLGTWLVGLVLAAVLPVVALTIAASWTAADRLRDGLEERMVRGAHALAMAVEQEFALHATALGALAASPALHPDPARPDLPALAAHVARVAARLGGAIAITAPDGQEWARSGGPLPQPLAPDTAARALATGRLAVSDLLQADTPQAARLALLLPLPEAGGGPAALAGLLLAPEVLRRRLAAHLIPEGGYITLTDARGVLVARSDDQHAAQLGQVVAPPPGAEAAGGLRAFTATMTDGAPCLIGESPIAGLPGWTLTLAVPLDAHVAALHQPLRWLVLGGLVAGALSGVVGWALGRQLLGPARALAAHARAIASENAGTTPEPSPLQVTPPAIRELEELRLGFAGAEAALRRRAEDAASMLQAQLQSEERLRAVLEQLPVGVTIAEAPSGRLLFHNARAEHILGHPPLPAETIGAYRQYGALHADGTPYAPEEHPLSRALLHGEQVEAEQMRYHRGNGVLTWLAVNAAPIRDAAGEISLAVCAFTDIGAIRAATEALAAAEARSRVLFQAAPVAAYVTDPRTRRILDCNATASAMLGRSPGALRRMSLAELDAGPRAGAVRRRASDNPRESRLRHRDGTLRDVLMTTVPIDLEGRRLLYTTALDVTDQRRAEAALADSEARLRLALEAAGLGSWEVDLRTNQVSRSGHVIPQRPDLPLAGYTLDEFFARAVHPEDEERVRATFGALARGEVKRYRMEHRVRRPDGEGWLHMESYGAVVETDPATGAPVRAAGTSRDVTERHEAEAALRASEERFRFALQAAGGIGTWDWEVGPDRMIADAAFAGLFAVEPVRAAAGLPSRAYAAAIHPEDRAPVHALLVGARRAESGGDFAAEHRVVDAAGRVCWVAARGRFYHDAAGRPMRFSGVVMDITARKEGEQRQALLASEVDHRAKNALAVAQSVVALTRAEDPAAFRAAVTGRITALARAHTLLASESWAGAPLATIIANEMAPYQDLAAGPEGGRIRIAGDPVDLAPGAVQPVAMTLHELATNAAKHGALSVPEGRLDVKWRRLPDGGLRLDWHEQGGPPLSGPPSRRGFGATLIEATMRRQLGGDMRLDWRPDGLRIEMELPAAQLRWRGPAP